jgi:LacI family fructose operon transcriptional repressor
VRQPIEEMGREMTQLLMQEIRDPDRAPRRVILDTQLMVRGSSAETD